MNFKIFIACYLALMLTAIAVIASDGHMTPSELKLKCQERQLWLLKAKVYEEAFMACSARYSRVLYNSELIAERCDEEVGRAQESRFTITHNLERSREYADKCGEF